MIDAEDGDDAVDGSLLMERADEGEYGFVVSVERPKMSTCRECVPLHLLTRSTHSSNHPTNESIIHPTQ
jgi:hypothetical protein